MPPRATPQEQFYLWSRFWLFGQNIITGHILWGWGADRTGFIGFSNAQKT
jgi:hypothetical protein